MSIYTESEARSRSESPLAQVTVGEKLIDLI